MDSRFLKDHLKAQISHDVDHVEEISGAGLALNAVELLVLLFVIVAALVKSYTALKQHRANAYNSSVPAVAPGQSTSDSNAIHAPNVAYVPVNVSTPDG